LVDEIKAVKSDEEIRLIRKTAELHDKVFEDTYLSAGGHAPLVRQGAWESEINSEIKHLASNMGFESALVTACKAAPAGTPAIVQYPVFQDHKLKNGDQVCFLLEFAGPEGFYGHMGRTVCIGQAPKPLVDLFRESVEEQDRIAELMKPGADPREIFASHDKRLASKGWEWNKRTIAHGQGYDGVERPCIRPEEIMKIKAGMNMGIDSTLRTKEAYAFCSNNFIVTDSGTILINKTPREVFVV
jgi:Xaa-Pro aminopeptidase